MIIFIYVIENNEDEIRDNVSDNRNSSENITTISFEHSLSNSNTANSVEIVETNSLSSADSSIMSSDIQMINVESFDDSNHHSEPIEVVLELNQLSGENEHIYEITPISATPETSNSIIEVITNEPIHQFGQRTTASPISVTPETSNSIIEVITNEPNHEFGQRTTATPISATPDALNSILDVNTNEPFHQFGQQTAATPISATPETSSGILDVNSIPIREDDLLDPNLFSTPICDVQSSNTPCMEGNKFFLF